MQTKVWLLVSLVAIVGCEFNKDQISCPLILHIPTHKISVFTQMAPENISIEIDGVLKHDDCDTEFSKTPPIVDLNRLENWLEIFVEHHGAYESLPEFASVTIRDKGTCTGEDSVFFEAENLPLDFETTYPNGEECGSKIFAEVSIEGPSL